MDGWLSTAFPGFKILNGYFSKAMVVLRIASEQRGNHCPGCAVWSERVHSSRYRTVQDLPISGAQVILRVRARKFFCDNPLCARKIFSERFGNFLLPSQQMTTRLNETLTEIGLALGGNPGAAFCRHCGISVGKDVVLRRIKALCPHSEGDMEVIGIDDWAYRRGQRYGTIICDLKRHRVVDLLPDRSVSTVADWLRAHPGIRVVSRDRAGVYADAIRQGLPSATQVADRWHLLKNLGDAVERYLARHRLPLREGEELCELVQPLAEPKRSTRKQEQQSARQAVKWERVQQVQRLHQSGLGIREISRQTGLSRQTVRTYLTWTKMPKTVRRPRRTLLDPYKRLIADLLNESYSGVAIFRRIQEQGYQGSRSTVAQYVADLRRSSNSGQEIALRHRRVNTRSAARLLARSDDEMDEDDKLYLKKLLEQVDGAGIIQGLCQSFRALFETHDPAGLDKWLGEAMACNVRELRAFAHGIKRDYDAVAAGITEPWSNGQVEGQVNGLKMFKRQMYGRASFALLRTRVLCSGRP
jgi:transposase